MMNFRLVLLATTALTVTQLANSASHAQGAPLVVAQAQGEEGKTRQGEEGKTREPQKQKEAPPPAPRQPAPLPPAVKPPAPPPPPA
ncbi:MAG: OmpA family protein, partial [Bradyrhizobium sp.]